MIRLAYAAVGMVALYVLGKSLGAAGATYWYERVYLPMISGDE